MTTTFALQWVDPDTRCPATSFHDSEAAAEAEGARLVRGGVAHETWIFEVSDPIEGDLEMSEITEDRRELWRLENFLAVSGTTQTHRERHLSLYRYLNDTCEHEWRDVSGWGGSAKGTRQCSWCNAVLAPGECLAPASKEPLPTENTHRAWQERYSARVIPCDTEAAQ